MNFIEHVVGPNERWDHLAYKYYANANCFAGIIRANRQLFGECGIIPAILPPGLHLRIPIVFEMKENLDRLPPWKREQA